jgi:hypothetical protein
MSGRKPSSTIRRRVFNLPLRVYIYQSSDGKTYLSYDKPSIVPKPPSDLDMFASSGRYRPRGSHSDRFANQSTCAFGKPKPARPGEGYFKEGFRPASESATQFHDPPP